MSYKQYINIIIRDGLIVKYSVFDFFPKFDLLRVDFLCSLSKRLILLSDSLISINKISQKLQDTLIYALLRFLLDNGDTRRYNKRNETARVSVIDFTFLPFLYFCE